jgi:hypothetical protein
MWIMRPLILCLALLYPFTLLAQETQEARWHRLACDASRELSLRETTAKGTGHYSVRYLNNKKEVIHSSGKFSTQFAPRKVYFKVDFDKHLDDYNHCVLVRNDSVFFSNRQPRQASHQPLVLASSITSEDTRALQHGMLVDPAHLTLEMFSLVPYPLKRCRFKAESDHLVHVQVLSETQPAQVIGEARYDLSLGMLPTWQRFYRTNQPGHVYQEITWGWKIIAGQVHCVSIKQHLFEPYTIQGENYTQRSFDFRYDTLEPGTQVDFSKFQLDALGLAPGTVIADMRKDSTERWMVFEPEGDPQQQRLDRMLAQRVHLPLPIAGPGQNRWLYLLIASGFSLLLLWSFVGEFVQKRFRGVPG